MEYAPGPSNPIAITVTKIPKPATFESTGPPRAVANHEKIIPNSHTAKIALAIGVKNPKARLTAHAIKMAAIVQTRIPESVMSRLQRIPWTKAAKAMATRNNRSPKPGLPAGNVENSRCRCQLQAFPRERLQLEVTEKTSLFETPDCVVLGYHF